MLNYFSRKQIKKISKKRYLVSLFSFKIITEIFVILKDLIISGSASSKIEKYIASIKKYYTYERLISIYNILPKISFEFISIFLICLGIIFYSTQVDNYTSILTTLSLYLAAAVKMIPSASRIARNQQYIEVGKPILGPKNKI